MAYEEISIIQDVKRHVVVLRENGIPGLKSRAFRVMGQRYRKRRQQSSPCVLAFYG